MSDPELHKGQAKTARIPIKVVAKPRQKIPPWIRVQAPSSPKVAGVRALLRERGLHTVCEEAACPNLGECFHHGTATFMILGDLCTRRCPFCDVGHGTPLPPNPEEPGRLAEAVVAMNLKYVVITSVDRDDLRDGGAGHFAACVRAVRAASPATRVEILTPDFRGRQDIALDILADTPPDVMNHNLETVPRLYKAVRPGADYAHSLRLLREFRERVPGVPTKSGIMLGLGETDAEAMAVLADLRENGVDLVTVGQYLQPSPHHLAVERYVSPEDFAALEQAAIALGFKNVACAPLVRSSYHADRQAAGAQAR
jgi:lipoic acid synthetase